MMMVGKKLIGEGAEKYLPFCLSKLRFYASTWTGAPQSHTIRATGGVLMLIELWSKNSGQITIWAGANAVYEFFTQDIDGGNLLPIPGTITRVVRDKSTPVCATEGIVGRPWTLGKRAPGLPTAPSVNARRDTAYTWWNAPNTPSAKTAVGNTFMQSSLGDHSMMNNYDLRNTVFIAPDLNASVAPKTRSVGFDIPYTVYSKGQTKVTAPLLPAPLWWRRGAVQKVTHPDFGTRHFVVATDSFSNFYAYPVNEAPDLYPDPLSVQKVANTDFLPAWVVIPTIATMSAETGVVNQSNGGGTVSSWSRVINPSFTPQHIIPDDILNSYDHVPGWDTEALFQTNQYLWSFNSTATKAAAVVYGDQLDVYLNETSTNPDTDILENRKFKAKRLRKYQANLILPYWTQQKQAMQIATLGGMVDITTVLRSTVEVNIVIELTGLNPEDFTLTISTNQVFRSECALDAQYMFDDPRLAAQGYVGDELVRAVLRERTSVSIVGGVTRYDDTYLEIRSADAVKRSFYIGRSVLKTLSTEYSYLAQLGQIDPNPNKPYGFHTVSGTDYSHNSLTTTLLTPRIVMSVGVYAMDLRSLSFMFDCVKFDVMGVETRGFVGYAFGQIVEDNNPDVTSIVNTPAPPYTPLASSPLEYESPYAQFMFYDGVSTTPGIPAGGIATADLRNVDIYHATVRGVFSIRSAAFGIATHPNGHYALWDMQIGGATQVVDKICAYNRSEQTIAYTTTHLAAYNEAFGRNMVYADFTTGGIHENFPESLKKYALWREITPAVTDPDYPDIFG